MKDRHQQTGVSARLESEHVARLDKVAEKLSTGRLGLKVTRAAVVKLAMLRGLEAIERELASAK